MTRLLSFAALLSLAALLLLAACTGSTEAPNPVLLVVGYDSTPQATGADVGLVLDGLEGENRLDFLEASTRPLTFPATDYDVVDREGGRSALVVLSRSGNTPAGSTGILKTFSLTGIDPENPAGFRETAEVVINNFARIPTTLGPNPAFCPKRVQVTQSGNYAAVLNDPSLCGLQALPFIDILDLQGSRLLQRLTSVGGLSSSNLYLAQGASEDLLYYATRVAGRLQLQRAVMPRPGQTFGPDDRIVVTDVTNVDIAGGQNDALDLQRSGSGAEERLVFLYRESLLSVTGFSGEEEVGGFVDTARNRENAFVLRDDERSLEGTFILSAPEDNTLTFIPPPASLETVNPEATASLGAVSATFESVRDNAYFVAPGRVAILPLASFSSGDDLPDLRPEDISQLTNPSFITFAQAVPPTAVPTPTAP